MDYREILGQLAGFWNLVVDVWNQGVFGIQLGRVIIAAFIFIFFLAVRKIIARQIIRLKIFSEKIPGKLNYEVVKALEQCSRREKRTRQDDMEIEVRFKDLRAGMVLSRALRNAKGLLLLPRNTVMGKVHLSRLEKYQESNLIIDGIYVYRKKPRILSGGGQ